MTPRQRLIEALELREPSDGVVPHYEFQFQKEKELTGASYNYRTKEFLQAGEAQQRKMLSADAERYVEVARRLEHCAIRLHFGDLDGSMIKHEAVVAREIKRMAGEEFFVQGTLRFSTFEIPMKDDFEDLMCKLHTAPEEIEAICEGKLAQGIEWARQLRDAGCDGVDEFSDYCLNAGPIMSPGMCRRFITPYLQRLTDAVKGMGMYFLKHTDGDIMPILDQIAQTRPHALQSIEPVGATTLPGVKALVGRRMCLMGNVDCSTLVSGPTDKIRQLTLEAIEQGAPCGGFVLMSSNAIHFGVPMEHYMAMHETWMAHRVRKQRPA